MPVVQRHLTPPSNRLLSCVLVHAGQGTSPRCVVFATVSEYGKVLWQRAPVTVAGLTALAETVGAAVDDPTGDVTAGQLAQRDADAFTHEGLLLEQALLDEADLLREREEAEQAALPVYDEAAKQRHEFYAGL